MIRSLFRKASGPSHSDYRKSVAIKLAAFAIALAVFMPLTAIISRPKSMKDLSDGTLPFTFTTRERALQRELSALNAIGALPNQRVESQSPASKHIASILYETLSGPDFQSLKTSLDQFEAFSLQSDDSGEQADFQYLIELIKHSDGQFDSSFDLKPLQQTLLQCFSAIESSQQQVSLKDVSSETGISPLPDLQKILAAKFAIQLADGDQDGALKTVELMFKLANAALNSNEPDIFFLFDSVEKIARSLQTKCWTGEALRELQIMLQHQRTHPLAQRALLAFEREKTLITFERVRQTGLRSLNGNPPSVNILADSLRELKPDGTVKAAKTVWDGIRYDADDDELSALRLLGRLAGPGFMPYFKALEVLGPDGSEGPITTRLRTSLQMDLRKQSELIALLEASDCVLRLRLGMDVDKSRISPLNGKPYKLFKSQSRYYKAVYGKDDGEAVLIDAPALQPQN